MADLANLIGALDRLPRVGSYKMVRPLLADLRASELRALVAQLVQQFDRRVQALTLPDSVAETYQQDMRRIDETVRTEPDAYFSIDNDSFIKDTGIALQRLIAAGAQVIHETGVPRRIVLRARGYTRLRTIRCLVRAGGFSPFYECHTHERALEEFTEPGWRAFYARMAEQLAMYPHVRGLLLESWFLDPALASISPRLAYLRRVPVEEGGATSIPGASDPTSIELAIKTSPTRRELYERGEYMPTAHMVLWLRSDVMAWAQRRAEPTRLQTGERRGKDARPPTARA